MYIPVSAPNLRLFKSGNDYETKTVLILYLPASGLPVATSLEL